MSKSYFSRNKAVLNAIESYAPQDEKLLSIPHFVSAAHPLHPISSLARGKSYKNKKMNFDLVASNLIRNLQHTNCVLSKIYAAHEYLVKNSNNLSENEIPLANFIQVECDSSISGFISSLRVSVDQIVCMITTDSSKFKYTDCIGGFLKNLEEMISNNKFSITDQVKNNICFLIVLNVAANYVKHNELQFEAPSTIISLGAPAIIILDKKNDLEKFIIKFPWKKLTFGKFFAIWVDCDFLVKGFNNFLLSEFMN